MHSFAKYDRINKNDEEVMDMSQEQKLGNAPANKLFELVKGMKEQLDKQDEQIEYIVARLNHMRDKAHAKRESETSWPK